MPKSHRLIQGASGLGGAVCFRLNSIIKADSSTFGIMLGGFTKGKEKEGREKNEAGA